MNGPETRPRAPAPLDVFACPLEGIRLIEASAGTGKTWNICGLYLRLLLRREQPLTVQQILVVTFTKAATAELRDRIRQRIADVLAALEGRGSDPGDAFLPLLRASLDIDATEAMQRLAQALRTFDEAAIHTIHGFCQRALEDTPFSAGLPLRQEMLEDDSELREQAARDFWRRHVAGPGVAPGLAGLLLKCGDTPARFAELLERHAAKPLSRVEWPEPAGGPAIPLAELQAAYERLRALWQAERGAVLDCVEASRASLNGRDYKQGNEARAAAAWDEVFAAGRVLACLALGDKAHLLRESKFQPKARHPPCRHHAFFGEAEAFLQRWERFEAGLRDARIELLQRLLDEGGRGLRELKRQRRVVAFDDMLSNLHRKLVPATGDAAAACEAAGTLSGQLADRYPAALIDEFQDTDPLQFEIFGAVYAGRPHTALFLVGDPKQAIYSFRNADLHTYLKAHGAAQARYTLANNQRSSPALIGALNGLFGRNRRAFMLDGLDYHPVAAGDKARKPFDDASGVPRAPLQLWSLPPEGGQPMRKAAAQAATARACAAEIARLLGAAGAVRHDGRPLSAGDIAVLVRSHAEGSRMRAELARLNVGSVELAQSSVFRSVDAQELEDVLRAVLEPGRQGLLLNALATGLLGMDAPGLQRLSGDEAGLRERAARFAGHKAAWLRRGIAPMLRELMAQEGIEPRMLARADGERRLTNLRHLAECLHEAAREHASPEALLRWLQRQRRERGDAEATQVRLDSDRHLVRILTIHKSKGLEYPVVFCPFLWDGSAGGRGGGDAIGCEYHGDDNRHVIDYREAGDATKARIKAEKDAERLRLIYVALTRAVHRCYLVVGGYLASAGRGTSPRECSGNPLNWLAAGDGVAPQDWREKNMALADVVNAWERLAEDHAGAIGIEPLPQAAGVALPLPVIDAGRLSALPAPPLPAQWRLGSYSGLARGAGHDHAAVDHDVRAARREAGRAAREELADDDILRFPGGAREGTCLHAVFEHADFGDPQTWPAAIEAALRRHPPAGSEADGTRFAAMVHRMLGDVLATPLGQGFSLSEVPRARARAELAFTLASPRLESRRLDALLRRHGYGGPELVWQVLEGYLQGAIDLVHEHAGRWWIVDWKSNHLGWEPRDYQPDALRKAMDDSGYHLQLLLYTVAVHRWLQRRLPGYDYERHFGGVHYLFVRGVRPGWRSADGRPLGVHFDRPALALVQALEALFGQGGAR